ncbi:unnamed protein product [marine sediment metagenome]|uniref:Uncharacterized protein n=1 Tax=marine sediment metagenome TaxID=412755 RepID=X1JQA0_9ZZZZ
MHLFTVTVVVDKVAYADGLVELDSELKALYWGTNLTFTKIDVDVRGWII